MTERHASEMGANTQHDQPFRLLDPRLVSCRIDQIAQGRILRLLDLFRGPVPDKHRVAAPFNRDDRPGSILLMSTSVEARASVDASGLIWLINGHTTEPTPTAPTAPVAMYKKSLRVGGVPGDATATAKKCSIPHQRRIPDTAFARSWQQTRTITPRFERRTNTNATGDPDLDLFVFGTVPISCPEVEMPYRPDLMGLGIWAQWVRLSFDERHRTIPQWPTNPWR